MSTTTAPRIELGVDDCVVVPATWAAYTELAAARGEKSQPRYIFVDGRLTILAKGCRHECIKTRVGGLLHEILVGLDIPFKPVGSVTLLSPKFPPTGVEADETYYLSNLRLLDLNRDIVMREDPAPDLVVEVVVSHPLHDSPEAYRRFGVKEVWLVTETGIEFLIGASEGGFVASPSSGLMPFLNSEEITPWALREDAEGETRARREFRVWVAETLAPRLRGKPEGENSR